MANYSKIEIEVTDWATIMLDLAVMGDVHNTAGDYTRHCPLFASDTPSVGYYVPETSNQVTAQNIADAFDAAFGPTGAIFQLPIAVSTIEGTAGSWVAVIEMTEYGWDYWTAGPARTGLTITTTNEVLPGALGVASIVTSAALVNSPNTHVRHKVNLSEGAVFPVTLRMGDQGSKECATADDVWFEYIRYTSGVSTDTARSFNVFDEYFGSVRVATGVIPNVPVYEQIAVTQYYPPDLSFVTAQINDARHPPGVELYLLYFTWSYYLYKLVGLDYVLVEATESNVWNITENGTYKVVTADNFSGIYEIVFVITAIGGQASLGKPEPYLRIESENSLKYYEVNNDYPFFDNAKMSDQPYRNVEMQCYSQKIEHTDVITTQIKSTYTSLFTQLLDSLGVAVYENTATKKVQNTQLQDKRDCVFLRSDDGYSTYIYFNGGNLYDPGTTDIIGTYYQFGSTLPSWVHIGMSVLLTGDVAGVFDVTDIVYSTTVNRWVMVVSAIMTVAGPTFGACDSVYAIEDYDIYEVDIPFSAIPDGYYTVKITATDTDIRYDETVWLSEQIYLKTSHSNNDLVTYRNDENSSQMDYSTGIINQLRVPSRFVKWSPAITSNRFKSDGGLVVQLKSVVTRVIEFETSFIPQYLAEKLIFAAGCDDLSINGYSVSVEEDPEIEEKISDNNPFYTVKMMCQLTGSINVIQDRTGLVSGSASALAVETDTVLGV